MTTLPYLANSVTSILVSPTADALIATNRASRTAVRRLSQALGMLGASTALLAAAYSPQRGLTVALLTMTAYGSYGLTTTGYSSAYLDVGQQGGCSGQIMSVSNTMATLPGILAPLIVEAFTRSLGPMPGYRLAFGLFGFGMSVPALLFFCTCFHAVPFKYVPKDTTSCAAVVPTDALVAPAPRTGAEQQQQTARRAGAGAA